MLVVEIVLFIVIVFSVIVKKFMIFLVVVFYIY